jgi:tRNA-specific 2-thiouridylase
MYDFQTEYRQKVVDYMVREYQAGRTPNPDIMCNQEVKFKLFLETALTDGADMIATGHYAKVKDGILYTAANKEKDQTYFLYRVNEGALTKSLMPIGDIATKDEVRVLAKKFGLATADKKDSQGICFVGKVGIKDFLLHELGRQPAGDIIDQHGKTIGRHDGAIFYTVGQRHGLDVGGGLPYYVTGKDMERNEVFVTTQLDDEKLWRTDISIGDLHWIHDAPKSGQSYQVRTRYRAPLTGGTIELTGKDAIIHLEQETRAVTAGQSAVVYADDQVIGGGIVV